MSPKKCMKAIVANVVKRTCIAPPTVEVVAKALFDEIRRQLTEGDLCVPIESFGTFAVVDIPERERRYTYKGADEIRTLPPKKQLKFRPAYNLRQEVSAQTFDPTRHSFEHHPDDYPISTRGNMRYNRRKTVFLERLPEAPASDGHAAG